MVEVQGQKVDIAALRKHFPMLQECLYFNSAWAGVTAAPVIQKLLDEIAYFEQQAELVYYEMQGRMNAARARLAALIGVTADDLVFTRNASDGINLVLWGITWQAGDEVIISNEEHPAVNNPTYYLQSLGALRLKVFEVSTDPDTTLRNIKALITPRTRMIACSHVSCQTGTRLPAKEICALAAEHGLLVLLDGAQSVGQFPIDVANMGVDFYVSNGHKWLHGPNGTGLLYVKRSRYDVLKPLHVGATSFEQPTDLNNLRLVDSAKRYEYGTRSYGTYAGLSAALDWLDGLGWSWVEQRMKHLSDYLKERLKEVPGTTLLSPREWELSSTLVSFSIEGTTPQALRAQLWDKGKVRSRIFPDRPVLRVSPAYFNTEEELDRLIDLLCEVVTTGK